MSVSLGLHNKMIIHNVPWRVFLPVLFFLLFIGVYSIWLHFIYRVPLLSPSISQHMYRYFFAIRLWPIDPTI